MMRRDKIFENFMDHPVLQEEYGIKVEEIPDNLHEGLKSDNPIIRTIALIVSETESNSGSEKSLYALVSNYLNSAAI